jgi:putative transcriptional regulator
MMSKILENVRADAKALHRAGVMDTITLREIETLCLPQIMRYSSDDIRAIRHRTHLSQAVFAKVLNVEAVTVQKWEQGSKKPGGASLRLLQIVDRRGLDVMLVG